MKNKEIIPAIVVLFIILGIIFGFMYGVPKYNVWRRGMTGQAELAQAEQNRKIRIQEALAGAEAAKADAIAKKETAKALAEAEIIRAKGVAEANRIIGDSLRGNESYLRYLWIQGLSENDQDVIYVPTEANLPILEAGNRK